MSAMSPQDFNNLITSLMSSYNSQTTAHAGYIIALTVGIAAILYQIKLKDFLKFRLRQRMFLFYFPLSILIGAIIFVILRIIFWAWMSSEVVTVPNNIPGDVTTPLYLVQNSLIAKLLNQAPGWTNLSYSLNQQYFGITFVFSIIIVLFYMWLLDFCYFYLYREKDITFFHILCTNKKNWRRRRLILVYVLVSIPFIILAISLFYPPLITSHLGFLIKPLPASTKVIVF
jgi:hypothetical protein